MWKDWKVVSRRIAKRTAPQTAAPPVPGEAPGDAPRVAYLVGRLERALRKRISETLLPFKLSVAQYTTLSVIRTHSEASNADLATRAFISPQAMNEVVQTLERRKLVTRRPDPSHGRIVRLLLTMRGRDTLHECDAAVRRLEQLMLAGLGVAEREALRTTLLGCAQALETRTPS
jgi:DNA-binding MarR family transcriptional regulator